jgi:hypothetical protein
MGEQKYTPEILNKAFEPYEKSQYRSLVDLLLNGKALNAPQQQNTTNIRQNSTNILRARRRIRTRISPRLK